MKIHNIVLIGSGNLATNLAIVFVKAGLNIQCIYSRNIAHAQILADKIGTLYTDNLNELPRTADLYLISISDSAIQQVVHQLAECKGIFAHTSGSIDISVFADTCSDYGVFYPLMNFSATSVFEFKHIPLCIEAHSDENHKALESLGKMISNHVQNLDSANRKITHLAAVFVCNFTNLNYIIAEEILAKHHLSFDLLRPLILETAIKAQSNSPMQLQTGPAIRNDKDVLDAHIRLLDTLPEYKEIYKLLTKNIQRKRNEKL
ncbi:MAG: DUF2520 domain-containing protein [Bacteroidota bacterium]